MKLKDPVCQKTLDDDSQHQIRAGNRIFYFCSEKCKQEYIDTFRLYKEKVFKPRPVMRYRRLRR